MKARSLWMLLTLCLTAGPVVAQEGVRLGAIHLGELLPEGTKMVVLSEAPTTIVDGRYQPEFFDAAAYPLERDAVAWRGVIGADGRTAEGIQPTQEANRLYFLYALTPDGTIYSSYSMEREALKYDVVAGGMMSVAPVHGSAAAEIKRRMFAPPGVDVVVHMPERRDDEPDAAEDAPVGEPVGGATSVASETDAVAAAKEPEPDTVTESQTSAVPAASVPPPPIEASSVSLPYIVFYGLLALVVILVGIAGYFYHIYRAEQDAHRKTLFKLNARFSTTESAEELHY